MSVSPSFNPSKSPNYGFTVPESPSENLQALLKYFSTVQRLDAEGIIEFFDDSLEHRIVPESLGRPVLNKKQYGEYVRATIKFFRWVEVTIHQVVEADDILTAHASSVGESNCGTPYSNELMVIYHYVPPPPEASPDALPKIRYAKEFVDSAKISKFYTEEREKVKRMEAAKLQGRH